MIDKAIALVEKQIKLYRTQENSIAGTYRKNTVEGRVKLELQEQIRIRKYILKLLKERRNQNAKEKRRENKGRRCKKNQ